MEATGHLLRPWLSELGAEFERVPIDGKTVARPATRPLDSSWTVNLKTLLALAVLVICPANLGHPAGGFQDIYWGVGNQMNPELVLGIEDLPADGVGALHAQWKRQQLHSQPGQELCSSSPTRGSTPNACEEDVELWGACLPVWPSSWS